MQVPYFIVRFSRNVFDRKFPREFEREMKEVCTILGRSWEYHIKDGR